MSLLLIVWIDVQLKKKITMMKKMMLKKEAECLVLTPPVYMEEGFGKNNR